MIYVKFHTKIWVCNLLGSRLGQGLVVSFRGDLWDKEEALPHDNRVEPLNIEKAGAALSCKRPLGVRPPPPGKRVAPMHLGAKWCHAALDPGPAPVVK